MLSLAGTGCSDSCDDVECYNGGICVDGDCICPEGWTGSDCSTPTSNSISCEPVEFNGYTYETVAIGTQCWFAENLRSENYRNGDAIPEVQDGAEWFTLLTGVQAYHGNSTTNLATYGRLYNWHAVDDARGLCPNGWHVPSDGEWTELTDYLGGTSVAGSQMKSSASDTPPWDGSNSSGFSGLPGGSRSIDGNFNDAGSNGYWWSSSPSSSSAWYRGLNSTDYVSRYTSTSLRNGFSVRCVRD